MHNSKLVFKDYSPNKILLLPPSLEELISENHPVQVVNNVIGVTVLNSSLVIVTFRPKNDDSKVKH